MKLTQKRFALLVNDFSTVCVNREMQLKFPYQEQLISGHAMWKTTADAHQERKGVRLKKESTKSCLMSSEEATPKAGKNTKQRRRGTLVGIQEPNTEYPVYGQGGGNGLCPKTGRNFQSYFA